MKITIIDTLTFKSKITGEVSSIIAEVSSFRLKPDIILTSEGSAFLKRLINEIVAIKPEAEEEAREVSHD